MTLAGVYAWGRRYGFPLGGGEVFRLIASFAGLTPKDFHRHLYVEKVLRPLRILHTIPSWNLLGS